MSEQHQLSWRIKGEELDVTNEKERTKSIRHSSAKSVTRGYDAAVSNAFREFIIKERLGGITQSSFACIQLLLALASNYHPTLSVNIYASSKKGDTEFRISHLFI